MKTKELMLFGLITLFSLTSFSQDRENRFGFELSTGASLATSKLNDVKLKPGFGFEGIFHYRFMPHLGVYGGWGWNRFGADNSFAGDDVCFEETGYVFGLEFKHPVGNSSLSYYVRGGGLYNHIETENAEGDIINATKHGLGFQLAGGIDLNLGSNWSLTPGIKFNSLSRESEFEGASKQMDLNYLSLRVGILKKF
ncbi:MAG: porin family protein [Mariniphaga sp.]|nr:porin family protein [Mariniphaga sp.]